MRDSSTRTKDRKLSTESPTWTVQGYANSKRLHFVYQLLNKQVVVVFFKENLKTLEFFLNGAERSLNSVNSEKLINH